MMLLLPASACSFAFRSTASSTLVLVALAALWIDASLASNGYSCKRESAGEHKGRCFDPTDEDEVGPDSEQFPGGCGHGPDRMFDHDDCDSAQGWKCCFCENELGQHGECLDITNNSCDYDGKGSIKTGDEKGFIRNACHGDSNIMCCLPTTNSNSGDDPTASPPSPSPSPSPSTQPSPSPSPPKTKTGPSCGGGNLRFTGAPHKFNFRLETFSFRLRDDSIGNNNRCVCRDPDLCDQMSLNEWHDCPGYVSDKTVIVNGIEKSLYLWKHQVKEHILQFKSGHDGYWVVTPGTIDSRNSPPDRTEVYNIENGVYYQSGRFDTPLATATSGWGAVGDNEPADDMKLECESDVDLSNLNDDTISVDDDTVVNDDKPNFIDDDDDNRNDDNADNSNGAPSMTKTTTIKTTASAMCDGCDFGEGECKFIYEGTIICKGFLDGNTCEENFKRCEDPEVTRAMNGVGDTTVQETTVTTTTTVLTISTTTKTTTKVSQAPSRPGPTQPPAPTQPSTSTTITITTTLTAGDVIVDFECPHGFKLAISKDDCIRAATYLDFNFLALSAPNLPKGCFSTDKQQLVVFVEEDGGETLPQNYYRVCVRLELDDSLAIRSSTTAAADDDSTTVGTTTTTRPKVLTTQTTQTTATSTTTKIPSNCTLNEAVAHWKDGKVGCYCPDEMLCEDTQSGNQCRQDGPALIKGKKQSMYWFDGECEFCRCRQPATSTKTVTTTTDFTVNTSTISGTPSATSTFTSTSMFTSTSISSSVRPRQQGMPKRPVSEVGSDQNGTSSKNQSNVPAKKAKKEQSLSLLVGLIMLFIIVACIVALLYKRRRDHLKIDGPRFDIRRYPNPVYAADNATKDSRLDVVRHANPMYDSAGLGRIAANGAYSASRSVQKNHAYDGATASYADVEYEKVDVPGETDRRHIVVQNPSYADGGRIGLASARQMPDRTITNAGYNKYGASEAVAYAIPLDDDSSYPDRTFENARYGKHGTVRAVYDVPRDGNPVYVVADRSGGGGALPNPTYGGSRTVEYGMPIDDGSVYQLQGGSGRGGALPNSSYSNNCLTAGESGSGHPNCNAYCSKLGAAPDVEYGVPIDGRLVDRSSGVHPNPAYDGGGATAPDSHYDADTAGDGSVFGKNNLKKILRSRPGISLKTPYNDAAAGPTETDTDKLASCGLYSLDPVVAKYLLHPLSGTEGERAVREAPGAGVGSYLVRRSKTDANAAVLVLLGPRSEVRQYKIAADSNGQVTLTGLPPGKEATFASLDECLAYCTNNPISTTGLFVQPQRCSPFIGR